MAVENEYVADPGERGAIADDAGKAHLLVAVIDAERDRALDGAADQRLADLGGPLGPGEEGGRGRHVEPLGIRADRVRIAPPLDAARHAGPRTGLARVVERGDTARPAYDRDPGSGRVPPSSSAASPAAVPSSAASR